ncbi:hypothetical protein FZEAL_8631 [Fusarium zealandicum]|uniref:Peptidase A1 domain-containing protein n=1 Tax=Fusarium zealandicum TaxID=1053134 RepID=A0A8H4UEF2_9HYPO|nr:hypothetical protein FZEAL_8631 [Fusarium zealandicum]
MHATSPAYVWASMLLLGGSSMAKDCVPLPLSMGIDNVTLANGFSRRGINLKIGTPEQTFSFMPRWGNNNTFLYGPNCDEENRDEGNCETFRGGFYVPKDSKSKKDGGGKDDEPLSEPFDKDTYDIITDTITWADDLTLQDFPIARPKNTSTWDLQGYSPQNIIGMDSGSTILTSLKNAGRIASRSWSFWWGLDGINSKDQKGGSFVLGGYDRAKAYGDGLTTSLSNRDRCGTGMVLNIQDMVLNFKNGTDYSIFPQENGGTVLQGCISPDTPAVMAVPYDPYWENFGNAIDSLYSNNDQRTFGIDFFNLILMDNEEPFDGDLTFKLDSSLEITIPNRQLVIPERTIDKNGEIIANASNPVIRINPLQDVSAKTFPYLGRYFLTAAYVVLNEDANEFTLYQANPSSEEDLVALDEDNKSIDAAASCTVAPTATAEPGVGETGGSSSSGDGSSGSGSEDGSAGNEEDSGLSTGAIAGIAVGVCVPAIAAIAGLIWWLMKRRKNNDQNHLQSTAQYMSAAQTDPSKPGYSGQAWIPQEMATNDHIPQEMAADNQPRRAPAEMPG